VDDLARALSALGRGGVIVYPTETVYGLGADVESSAALARLALLKGREAAKPVSVLVASRAMLDEIAASISAVAERLIGEFWPGPLTLAFTARPGVANVLTAGSGTIAARISSHPTAQALVARLGRPLTSTSANPAGAAAALDVEAARRYFGDEIDAYVDGGKLAAGAASTVVDCSELVPRIVREGAISRAAIEAAAGMRLARE
jgi:L-threonylcarbamoyladenylate synthase